VRPRSGLAFKKGLTVVNAPGTIDSDYRGEVKILVINLGKEAVEIAPQDRIAQWVIQKVDQMEWVEVDGLAETARGAGGFGSTGVANTNA
jgi:dUTP pyrophosphatase